MTNVGRFPAMHLTSKSTKSLSICICICICIWSYRQKNLVIPASEDNPIALSLNKSKKTLRLFLHLWRACHHLEKFEIFSCCIISSLLISLLFPLVFTLQSTFLRPPIWHRSSAPSPRNKVGWFSQVISKTRNKVEGGIRWTAKVEIRWMVE